MVIGNLLAADFMPKSTPPGDGALVGIPGTHAGCPSAGGAFHPNGRYRYLATAAGAFGNVCAFAFDPVARVLAPVPGSPFASGGDSQSIALDPSGTFAYVANTGVAGSVFDRVVMCAPVP